MSDNYLVPAVTDEGISMLVRCMNGEAIKFTKIVLGDGIPEDPLHVSQMKNPRLEIAITGFEKKEGYLLLNGSCNNGKIDEAFYAKEIGIYAAGEDGNESLYAYKYAESEVEFFPSKSSSRTLEIEISVIAQIGKAENVSAIISKDDAYVSKADFQAHCEEKNPHMTTAEDVGASPVRHKHSTADISSGILPVSFGGTGVNSYDALAEKMNIKPPVFGRFKGDGTVGRIISLGFRPRAVILCDSYGNIGNGAGGIAVGKYGCHSSASVSASTETEWNSFSTLQITSNGFKVSSNPQTKVFSNIEGRSYHYIAFR